MIDASHKLDSRSGYDTSGGHIEQLTTIVSLDKNVLQHRILHDDLHPCTDHHARQEKTHSQRLCTACFLCTQVPSGSEPKALAVAVV